MYSYLYWCILYNHKQYFKKYFIDLWPDGEARKRQYRSIRKDFRQSWRYFRGEQLKNITNIILFIFMTWLCRKQYFICKDPEVIVNIFILIDYMDSVRMTTCMVNCIFSRIALFWLINYNHECFSHEMCFMKRCFMCALCFCLSKFCYCFHGMRN